MASSKQTGDAEFTTDVVVVGGGGHVGLPLAIALANRGASVVIYDISASAVDGVNNGRLPFIEPGAEPLLRSALDAGLLRASTDPAEVANAENVVVVIGTPVDDTPALLGDALAAAGNAPGYPTALGTLELRTAAAGWLERRTRRKGRAPRANGPAPAVVLPAGEAV